MTDEIIQLKARINELENENIVLKQQQIEINKAKELYLKIFEEFPALIWRSRLDKLCDYFNKTWYEFTGRSFEQEFGNGWAEGVHPDDFNFCLEIYVAAFDKREPFLMEYRLKNKHGEYRWIRDFGRPFYDLDNTFLGYIGSCYDITEIKATELKLLKLNAAKDKFLSIIAHDLKNPFNSILLSAELLKNNFRKNETKFLEKIADDLYISAENTYNLLENLLEWASAQSNGITFDPQKLYFTNIYNEVLQNLSSNANTKNIIIDHSIQENLEFFADKNMIKTILRNLISNAIKYSHINSKIKISAELIDNSILVEVTDTGIGIKKEKLDAIFDISKIISTHGTANEKGTGLGLILCKEFIEKHDGKIWVESNLGQGSSFKFTIPLISNEKE